MDNGHRKLSSEIAAAGFNNKSINDVLIQRSFSTGTNLYLTDMTEKRPLLKQGDRG